jgi:hypothetical protein
LQGGGNPPEENNGNVSLAGFELGEVALGNIGLVRNHLAGHFAAIAELPDAIAKEAQKVCLGGSRGGWV